MRAVGRQRVLSVDETASFANSPRANFVEPDRPKDGEQPTVEPGSRNELIRALDRARTVACTRSRLRRWLAKASERSAIGAPSMARVPPALRAGSLRSCLY